MHKDDFFKPSKDINKKASTVRDILKADKSDALRDAFKRGFLEKKILMPADFIVCVDGIEIPNVISLVEYEKDVDESREFSFGRDMFFIKNNVKYTRIKYIGADNITRDLDLPCSKHTITLERREVE